MHKLIIFPCRERVAVRRSDEHLALSREPAHRRHWNFGRAHSDQLGRRDQHLATWLVAGGPGHRSQRDRITDLSFGARLSTGTFFWWLDSLFLSPVPASAQASGCV